MLALANSSFALPFVRLESFQYPRSCSLYGQCCAVWFRLQRLSVLSSEISPSCSRARLFSLCFTVLAILGIGKDVVVLVVVGISYT